MEDGQPTRPTWLVDAIDGSVAFHFEGLTTADGRGPGGNQKTGRYDYGIDFPAFTVTQSGTNCTMQTADVRAVNLNHGTSGSTAYSFTCDENTFKQINGAFSPINDAYYFGQTIFNMYSDWYQTAPLTFQLLMRVHYSSNYENAFWNGSSMTFGDGRTRFYPLVSLDVSSHEVAHGFTEQNSGLIYSGQSGGINEAFSDMAGEAAEYYMHGTNDFLVGAEIFKASGALRYMHNPPLDGRSIGSANDYTSGMGVHFSSGVFNKAFWVLANRSGWDTRTAFDVFVKANQDYWTPSTDFQQGAQAVYDSAQDLGYNTSDVVAAFAAVDITLQHSGSNLFSSSYQVLGDGSGVHTYPALTGDFNGDGKTDIAFIGQGWNGAGLNIRTKFSNGNGTWSSSYQVVGDGSGVHTYPALTGDFNGDGKTDIAFIGQGWNGAGLNIRTKFSNGNGTWSSSYQVLGDGSGVHTYPALTGDFNGDGKTDIAFIGQGWNGAGLNIRTKLSNGNGTWSASYQVLGDGSGVHTYPALTGDYNGDGKTDIAFIGQGWNGAGLNVRTKFSNGNGTWSASYQVLGDGSGVHTWPARVNDINGDGKSDLVFMGQGWNGAGLNIRTKRSNGNGTWSSHYQVLGDGSGVHSHPALTGDVDGDGHGDLIFMGQGWNGAGLNIRIKYGSSGNWSSAYQVLGDGSGVHTWPALPGDYNGDGKTDIVFIGQGWNGAGLNIRTKFAN